MQPVTPVDARKLTARQRAQLATEITASYVLARWWLARLSFPLAVAAARRTERQAQNLSAEEATAVGIRLGRAVERVLHQVPFDSRCLVRALVLSRMLARRGIESSLVLGVNAHPIFAAHAWVETRGAALLPTGSFHRLTEL